MYEWVHERVYEKVYEWGCGSGYVRGCVVAGGL